MWHWISAVTVRPWLRILLAVILVMVGLAPVGAPILSDNELRNALVGTGSGIQGEASEELVYRWRNDATGAAIVERSEDRGATWLSAGSVPGAVRQIALLDEEGQMVIARGEILMWRSNDSGETWEELAALPSRPWTMAVGASHVDADWSDSSRALVRVFVGTESMGLYASDDAGESWRAIGDSLNVPGAGATGVSALAVNSDDPAIVYAAPGYWLGTSQAQFASMGTVVSVDGGQHWFPLEGGAWSPEEVESLVPVTGSPLDVTVVTGMGKEVHRLRVTDELEAYLDDADPGLRASAARAIGLSGEASLAAQLLEHFDDPDDLAGDAMAAAVGDLGGSAVVARLLEYLDHDDEMVRARAAYAIGVVGEEAAVPRLLTMLQDDGPFARRRAAESLGMIGTSEAIAGLIGSLDERELSPVRHAAMQGLEVAGRIATPGLVAALHDDDASLRRSAAEMLGFLAEPSATEDLSRLLDTDPSPEVRAEAAWALGEVGTPSARHALAQALENADSELVRHSVLEAQRHVELRVDEQATARGSWLEALMGALSTVPASRWSFLMLVILLAGFLMWASPHRIEAQRSKH